MAHAKTPVTARQEEDPRLALRLARFFIGKEYEEEALPAEVICVIYGVATVVVMVVAVAIGFFIFLGIKATSGSIL